MFARRLRCHFCGSRQPHERHVTSFRCDICDATNFLDGTGNIVDAPATATSMPSEVPRFTSPASASSSQPHEQVFCARCIQNQHIYNEMLANYLPDDDDPRYPECERRLPEFKADLEKRYPLICSKCAPIAQQQIHQADYYGMSQNAARLCADTRTRGGRMRTKTRDDGVKRTTRLLLALAGATMYAGLFTQVAFHIYAAFFLSRGTAEQFNNSSLTTCAIRTSLLKFDLPCFQRFSRLVPATMQLALILLPYNTGHRHWFDGSVRVEAVNGQKQYFFMQIIMLLVRYSAWHMSTQPASFDSTDKKQLLAIQIFAAAFLLIAQWLADRSIEPVKWKLSGNMMPLPSEKDVLGAVAGASQERYTPQASDENPYRYLHQPQLDSTITSRSPTDRSTSSYRPYPSPAYSDNDDAMETDFEPMMRSQPRAWPRRQEKIEHTDAYVNHGKSPLLGLGDMRTHLEHPEEKQQKYHYGHNSFDVQPQAIQRYSSPFSRPVPPAPASLERQYRSPWASQRPAVAEVVPVSQQKDFMNRMRAGVQPITMSGPNTDFQLQKGKLRLASDNKETGLEDSFNKHFSFSDPGTTDAGAKESGWLGGLLG